MANSGPSKTNNNAARPPRFCGANFLEKLDLKCKDVYKNLPANSVLKRPDSRAALVFLFLYRSSYGRFVWVALTGHALKTI